jgi:MFS family permease
MAGEWSLPNKRGFATSFAQLGAPAGMLLANGCMAFVSASMREAQFVSWGWRLPFLASVLLLAVGFYIRVGILESPVFTKLKTTGKLEKAPALKAIQQNWREILLSALLRTGQHVPYYIFTTYVLSYGTQVVGFSRATLLTMIMAQSLVSIVTIPLFGHLSDRYGRRLIIAIGCTAMLFFPFVYFGALDTGSLAAAAIVIILSGPVHDLQYAPQAALIAESFPASVRYSGSAYGYQLASITAGGPAPIIATLLFQRFHSSTGIAVYIALSAAISLWCVTRFNDAAGRLDGQ